MQDSGQRNNGAVRSHEDLSVWQRAMELVVEIYQISKQLPPDERFELCTQMRKAAVSVAANIAEGHGRDHLGDYLHHLSIANGSLMEVHTYLVVVCRLRYLIEAETNRGVALANEVGRMISVLSRRLHRLQPQESRRRPKKSSGILAPST